MNINTGINYQYSNQNKSSTNFKAIPLARYKVPNKEFINVYQFEKSDLPFVTSFIRNIGKYFQKKDIKEPSKREIITNAMDTAQKVLSAKAISFDKTKILVAVNDKELCGIIVGNVPKMDRNGKIHYSSRKNHSNKETELDWLVTWNPFKNKNIKGVGKVLGCEYFTTAQKDGFKKVFIHSEVPEETFAQVFYEKNLGFLQLPNQREKIAKHSNNKYITGEYYLGDDEIIPMIAKKGKIRDVIADISEKYSRKPLEKSSVLIEYIN